MSTMDAQRALRTQRVEVPKIRALAAREGPILFAEGKGKPYVVDPVAFKVLRPPLLVSVALGCAWREGQSRELTGYDRGRALTFRGTQQSLCPSKSIAS